MVIRPIQSLFLLSFLFISVMPFTDFEGSQTAEKSNPIGIHQDEIDILLLPVREDKPLFVDVSAASSGASFVIGTPVSGLTILNQGKRPADETEITFRFTYPTVYEAIPGGIRLSPECMIDELWCELGTLNPFFSTNLNASIALTVPENRSGYHGEAAVKALVSTAQSGQTVQFTQAYHLFDCANPDQLDQWILYMFCREAFPSEPKSLSVFPDSGVRSLTAEELPFNVVPFLDESIETPLSLILKSDHQTDLIQLLADDEHLYRLAMEVVEAWNPVLSDLASGERATSISQDQINSLESFLDDVLASGNEAVQSSIELELAAVADLDQWVGVTIPAAVNN